MQFHINSWKYLSRKPVGHDILVHADIFPRVIGSNDKVITGIPVDREP
jgi:hypothetical protein